MNQRFLCLETLKRDALASSELNWLLRNLLPQKKQHDMDRWRHWFSGVRWRQWFNEHSVNKRRTTYLMLSHFLYNVCSGMSSTEHTSLFSRTLQYLNTRLSLTSCTLFRLNAPNSNTPNVSKMCLKLARIIAAQPASVLENLFSTGSWH